MSGLYPSPPVVGIESSCSGSSATSEEPSGMIRTLEKELAYNVKRLNAINEQSAETQFRIFGEFPTCPPTEEPLAENPAEFAALSRQMYMLEQAMTQADMLVKKFAEL